MVRLKQFVYQYDAAQLLRIPLARWQRVLSQELTEPVLQNRTIKIVYAYVEMADRKPSYCHRIEAVRYTFDADGRFRPLRIPDLDLLSGVMENKLAYLSTRRDKKQFFAMKYWDVTPQLLDDILATIWSEKY